MMCTSTTCKSAGRRARAVVMLDVIEHVPDPVRVLRNVVAMLDDDGAILLTVPAAPYLIGPWDRMLGHYRRYSARLLRDHAHEAGLRIAWLSHWNAFALPLAIVIRTAEKLSGRRLTAEFPAVSDTVNSLLIGLARAPAPADDARPPGLEALTGGSAET